MPYRLQSLFPNPFQSPTPNPQSPIPILHLAQISEKRASRHEEIAAAERGHELRQRFQPHRPVEGRDDEARALAIAGQRILLAGQAVEGRLTSQVCWMNSNCRSMSPLRHMKSRPGSRPGSGL